MIAIVLPFLPRFVADNDSTMKPTCELLRDGRLKFSLTSTEDGSKTFTFHATTRGVVVLTKFFLDCVVAAMVAGK